MKSFIKSIPLNSLVGRNIFITSSKNPNPHPMTPGVQAFHLMFNPKTATTNPTMKYST